MSFTLVE
jgi:hypothetical protein